MTHGNATGLGLADVITRALFDEIDFPATYGNAIASAYLDSALIPIVMPTERAAIQLAVKTVPRVKPEAARIVRIRDTLTLGEIAVSETLRPVVEADPALTVVSDPTPWHFEDTGILARTW
jgi:hypothetical protein